jgi:hypothetical protein
MALIGTFEGQDVYGSLSSADASAGAGLTWTDADGNNVTLQPNQRVAITDIDIVVGAAIRVDVFAATSASDNTVTDAKRIIGGSFAANGGISRQFSRRRYSRRGFFPRVKAGAAGQVDVNITGVVVS